jgi:hypothetical protein
MPADQMAEVMNGLQALDRLDPHTRSAIQAGLDRTHPANWHYVFRFHRAALAGVQSSGTAPGAAPGSAPGLWGFPRRDVAGPFDRKSPGATASRLRSSGSPPSSTLADRLPLGEEAKSAVAFSRANPNRQPRETDHPGALLGPEDQQKTPSDTKHWWPVGFEGVQTHQAVDGEREPAVAQSWRGHLQRAIERLEEETQDSDDKYGHALLRVLYAVAEQRDAALRPIPGVSETEREFWINEMRGLCQYLDSRQTGSPDRRAAEAARWFRDAAERLAELGVLEVSNLAFCTAVHSYGSVERFAKYEFQPGEEVLLYAEIENFKSEASKEGHRTSLKAHYDVLDGPRRVHQQDLPAAEEACERQRRDFFVSYRLRLPAELKPGEYTLQLTIDDALGQKTATRSIGFRIR